MGVGGNVTTGKGTSGNSWVSGDPRDRPLTALQTGSRDAGEPAAWAAGRGGTVSGGGGAAVRTSVAFIHLAAPIRQPVTHPPPPRRSLRGRAQADTRAGIPSRGLWVPCPSTCRRLGSSRTPLPKLWHPGGCTLSI